MSSILPSTGPDPVGAAALLGHADPAELDRFVALEDALWEQGTLAPAVLESVRLHCAQVRGCEFCKAVRYTAAIEDGLTEAQVARLEAPAERDEFTAAQTAALTLSEHFLRDTRKPDEQKAVKIAEVLGTAGVTEVLVACCAFASAELRIALGDNRKPSGSGLMERAGRSSPDSPANTAWPELDGAVLDPATTLPDIAPALASPIRERVTSLWSGDDLSAEIVAACILRSAQLQGVTTDDPVNRYLAPATAARLADPEEVRRWPAWPAGLERNVMKLAEQLWIDPAGVNPDITGPLQADIGVDGTIRVAWHLILIGQLHRLALVLHRRSH
jgi:alkylhydroperoxidase family enzyme